MKLTKRDIKRWVKALRSGEYEQATGALCRSYKDFDEAIEGDEKNVEEDFVFCCLGVACDLFLDGYWQKTGVNSWHANWRINGAESMPPDDLRIAINEALQPLANKRDSLGTLGDACGYLADRNDQGRSFKQIANIIERAAGLKK